jgi:4-hydroxy-tetrahydrodipicolinate synthase
VKPFTHSSLLKLLPRGSIAAVVTPISDALEPDTSALISLCRDLIDAGANGINLLGTTGEAMSLSMAQRLAVMRAVALAGFPMERFLVGTGAAALADAVELTHAAEELGYAGALVMPPFFYRDVDSHGLLAYLCLLTERSRLRRTRLVLYNYPKYSGITFTSEIIDALHAALGERLAGLKDSSAMPSFGTRLASEFCWLNVYPSNEIELRAPSHKFAGSISASLNITVAAVARGDFDSAFAVRQALTAFPLIAAVKSTLARLRSDSSWNRVLPPLRPLKEADAMTLSVLLKERVL